MYRKQPQPKPLAVAVMAALISLTALPALAQVAPAQDKKEEAKTLDALVVTASAAMPGRVLIPAKKASEHKSMECAWRMRDS